MEHLKNRTRKLLRIRSSKPEYPRLPSAPDTDDEESASSYAPEPPARSVLKKAMSDYHEPGREGQCKPDQCPTFRITKTPTPIFMDKRDWVVLLAWTSDEPESPLYVFFAETGFYWMLQGMTSDWDSIYTDFLITTNDQGNPHGVTVYFAFLVGEHYRHWNETRENKYLPPFDGRFVMSGKAYHECRLENKDDYFRCGDEAMNRRRTEILKGRQEVQEAKSAPQAEA